MGRLATLQTELLINELTLRFTQEAAIAQLAVTAGMTPRTIFKYLVELQSVINSLVTPETDKEQAVAKQVRLLQDARSRYKEAYGYDADDPVVLADIDKIIEAMQCQVTNLTKPTRSNSVLASTNVTTPGRRFRTAE